MEQEVKYETVKELEEEKFRRLNGVKRSTFDKIVEILPDLQIDIGCVLIITQSGKHCYGKTPIQTFLDILLFRK